jgi:hypothetical protein
MELSKFELPAAAREGIWFEVCLAEGRLVALMEAELPEWPGAEKQGAQLKLASPDTKEYQAALRGGMLSGAAEGFNRSARRRARRGRGGGGLPSGEQQFRAEDEALAEHVLIDWRGIEKDGQPLPCTFENRLEALRHERFRAMVIEAAQDFADRAEAELGNSANTPRPSSG